MCGKKLQLKIRANQTKLFLVMNRKVIVIYFHFHNRDREIQFFELSSFEPYCQIAGLETVPLKLDYR